jgi:hypothetical protein
VRRNLAEAIAKDVTEHLSVRLEHVRALNLLYNFRWIADPTHEPDTWPARHWEDQ